MDRAVHSNQIGRKCDQIFTDAITFEHALTMCTCKLCQLVAKQQYCDYHNRLKTTYKSVFVYLSKFKN